MIYPYRCKDSIRSASERKDIDAIIHQKDPISDIEYEMKKRGQKQENGADN